jgi:myo-inositol catabolism protein IolC
MEKLTAIKLAGNQTKLAAILGISQAAIAQWGEDVPLMRLYQLKSVKPEWFKHETQSASKSWKRSPTAL